MKLVIENFKKKHIDSVFDIMKRNLSDFKPKKNEYNKLWLSYKKDRKLFSVVASINKKILGHAKIIGHGSLVINSTIRGGKLGYIEDIVVEKKFRHLGYATQIVSNLKKISKEKGCYKIILQTKNHNIEFYKKNKFKKLGLSMVTFL